MNIDGENTAATKESEVGAGESARGKRGRKPKAEKSGEVGAKGREVGEKAVTKAKKPAVEAKKADSGEKKTAKNPEMPQEPAAKKAEPEKEKSAAEKSETKVSKGNRKAKTAQKVEIKSEKTAESPENQPKIVENPTKSVEKQAEKQPKKQTVEKKSEKKVAETQEIAPEKKEKQSKKSTKNKKSQYKVDIVLEKPDIKSEKTEAELGKSENSERVDVKSEKSEIIAKKTDKKAKKSEIKPEKVEIAEEKAKNADEKSEKTVVKTENFDEKAAIKAEKKRRGRPTGSKNKAPKADEGAKNELSPAISEPETPQKPADEKNSADGAKKETDFAKSQVGGTNSDARLTNSEVDAAKSKIDEAEPSQIALQPEPEKSAEPLSESKSEKPEKKEKQSKRVTKNKKSQNKVEIASEKSEIKSEQPEKIEKPEAGTQEKSEKNSPEIKSENAEKPAEENKKPSNRQRKSRKSKAKSENPKPESDSEKPQVVGAESDARSTNSDVRDTNLPVDSTKVENSEKPAGEKKQADDALDVHRTYAVYELERRNLWSKSRHNVDTIAFGGTIKARRKPAAQPEFVAVAEEKHFAPVNPAQVSVNKKMVNDVIVSLFETREKRTRKDLIDEAMKHYGLSEMQLSERSSTSLATRYKSLTGSVINELLEQRLIEYEGTELRLVNTVQETQQSINYKTRILTLLSDGQPRTRAGILNEIAGENNRKAPDSSDNSAKRDAKKRAFVGTALRQLEDMGEVFRRNGRYFVKQSEKYPATPIGAHFIDTEKVYLEAVAGRLRRAKYENKLKMAYMKAININGSVFMEILALKAVKVLFGKSVVSDELTAGPNDNGIDGIVEVIDPLGFREKILIQAKTRQRLNTSVTVKELREFAGVMQGARAAKGVMATNASIHEEGKRFAATIPNLTCIDKDRLFDIALKHSLGIIYDENGIPFLDAGLFINYSLGVSQPRHD